MRRAIIPNVQMAVVEDDPLVRAFVVDTLEVSENRKVHTLIICILASGNPADELRATEAGADAFVLKPYGVSDLLALVQAFVVQDKDRRGQIR